MPLVSIITPCYNHGQYLDDAIASIPYDQINYAVEHIIVNDGSTDLLTIHKLDELKADGHYIVNQNNQGLATARNNGIKIATGKYIIPLDADNKLHLNYFTSAIALLEGDDSIDVVYGNRVLFGNSEGVRKSSKFDINRILEDNYIDACAVFRKSVWQKVGGYDRNMPGMGNEDWEFWINIFFGGGKLIYINEICFYYRVLDNSMTQNYTLPNYDENKSYILKKHAEKIVRIYQLENIELRILRKKVQYLHNYKFRTIIKLILGRDV